MTVFMTAEISVSFTDMQFSADLISFLTDNIIIQRYVEIGGALQKVMAVVKMRGSQHDKRLRMYDITERGLKLATRCPTTAASSPASHDHLKKDARHETCASW